MHPAAAGRVLADPKLYRAAIVESDRSKLLQRVEYAEAAILERSRRLISVV